MRIKILTVTYLLFLTLESSSAIAKAKIVTSTATIGSIVAMLVKNEADIEILAANKDCPHHYHLKPSDLAKIQNADISIYINGQFDGFAKKLMERHSANIIKISDIKNLRIIADNYQTNWHIWLDLNNVKIVLRELALILAQKLPELKEAIYQNLEIAFKQLEDLKQIKSHKLKALQDAILLSDSTDYFFVDTLIKTKKLYSENQKSLKYVHKLRELLDKSSNKCLILSSNQDSRLYDRLNAKVIILASENWSVINMDSKTFYLQYLQMINQVEQCSKLHDRL